VQREVGCEYICGEQEKGEARERWVLIQDLRGIEKGGEIVYLEKKRVLDNPDGLDWSMNIMSVLFFVCFI